MIDLGEAPAAPAIRWQAQQLASTACAICGHRDSLAPIVRRPDGLQVVRCRECTLAFVDPRPRDDLISGLYDTAYFEGGDEHLGYESYQPRDLPERLDRAHLVRERLRITESATGLRGHDVLEVGCASGAFAAAAAKAGGRVTGVDIAPGIVEVARGLHPEVRFEIGDAAGVAASGRDFDVVCAFEVVEHVTDPAGFLLALRSLVRPGGWLVLSTPDVACGDRVGHASWLGFRTSFEHLYFFSGSTLDVLARRAGFVPHAHYGAGSGRWTSPGAPASGGPVRRLLVRLKLLGLARAVKARVVARDRYRPGEIGHNLIAVYRA